MSAQKRARAFSCPRFEFAVAQWRWRGRAPPPWAICAFFGRFSTNSPKSSPRAGQRSSNPHTNHGAAHLGPLYTRFSVIFRSFKTGLAGVDLPAFSFVSSRRLPRTASDHWDDRATGVVDEFEGIASAPVLRTAVSCDGACAKSAVAPRRWSARKRASARSARGACGGKMPAATH